MQLSRSESRDLLALLIGLSPFLWFLRGAIKQKPRNYIIIVGASVVILAGSLILLKDYLPDAVFRVFGLAAVFLALFTFVFAVASWLSRVVDWKLVAALGVLECVLVYLVAYWGPRPGGAWLICGLLAFFNLLVVVASLVGLIIRVVHKAS